MAAASSRSSSSPGAAAGARAGPPGRCARRGCPAGPSGAAPARRPRAPGNSDAKNSSRYRSFLPWMRRACRSAAVESSVMARPRSIRRRQRRRMRGAGEGADRHVGQRAKRPVGDRREGRGRRDQRRSRRRYRGAASAATSRDARGLALGAQPREEPVEPGLQVRGHLGADLGLGQQVDVEVAHGAGEAAQLAEARREFPRSRAPGTRRAVRRGRRACGARRRGSRAGTRCRCPRAARPRSAAWSAAGAGRSPGPPRARWPRGRARRPSSTCTTAAPARRPRAPRPAAIAPGAQTGRRRGTAHARGGPRLGSRRDGWPACASRVTGRVVSSRQVVTTRRAARRRSRPRRRITRVSVRRSATRDQRPHVERAREQVAQPARRDVRARRGGRASSHAATARARPPSSGSRRQAPSTWTQTRPARCRRQSKLSR